MTILRVVAMVYCSEVIVAGSSRPAWSEGRLTQALPGSACPISPAFVLLMRVVRLELQDRGQHVHVGAVADEERLVGPDAQTLERGVEDVAPWLAPADLVGHDDRVEELDDS